LTRNRLILLAVALLLAGLLAWQTLSKKEEGPSYVSAEVQRGDLNEAITANGVLNPISVINVGTQVSGTVQELKADFNDRVTQGQVLLRLDPALFASQLAASEAQLANVRAQAELQAANVRRAAELVKKDYISRQEYETVLASSRGADAQVRQAAARVAQDRANLDFSVIRAPVSGIVISREVDLGQTVAAAFSTPVLFRIARDLSRMQIEASVAEADIARIRPGQQVLVHGRCLWPAALRGPGQPDPAQPGHPAECRDLHGGWWRRPTPMAPCCRAWTADARFQVATRRNVLLLPNGALGFRPEGYKPQRGMAEDEAVVFVLEGTAGKTGAGGAADPAGRQ
jgi:HlyD family secretion protein